MNENGWRVEDVMDYFREDIEKEGWDVERLMALVVSQRGTGSSYFEKMNMIRDILVRRGHSIPFRSVYRRVKI